jgi:hypothetical protein
MVKKMTNSTPTPIQATSPGKRDEYERLTGEIAALEARLEDGMRLYDASNNAAQRQRYYEKWLPILREYEAKYQERRNLNYAPTNTSGS